MPPIESRIDRVKKSISADFVLAFKASSITLAILCAGFVGYSIGGRSPQPGAMEVLSAATAATGTNLAVATGAVSDDAEGVFFLDFLTGDLQCLVYYPRTGAFGAKFYTNVLQNLPASGKNSQYLLVTGGAVTSRAGAGARPGNGLVYVTDATGGNFAAYAVPWDRTSESAARPQSGPLVFVGGGPVRNYQVRDARPNAPASAAPVQPAIPADNAAKKAAKPAPNAADKQNDKPGDKKAKAAADGGQGF